MGTLDTERLYQSYLLRLWREGPQQPWRASLKSAATEQISHFGSFEELVAYLRTQMDAAAGGDPRGGRAEPQADQG